MTDKNVPVHADLLKDVFSQVTEAINSDDPNKALRSLERVRTLLYAAARIAGVTVDGVFSYDLQAGTVSPPRLQVGQQPQTGQTPAQPGPRSL